MRRALWLIVLAVLATTLIPQAHATSPAVAQGCTASVNSVFVQVLTVSCTITGVTAGNELAMWTWTCGPVCFQPLTSDVTITASDTFGLTWTSPTSGVQQYNGSSNTCTFGGVANCVVKEKFFYANAGVNSGNDTVTFTIAYTGSHPACNCADLQITTLELSNVIASPFDGSNGTAALCAACGAVLSDGTITLPSGVYTPTVTVVNGTNTFGYSIMFMAFRGTDTTDLLFASSSCTNCSGYVPEGGWTWEAGTGGIINNSDQPTIFYQLSGPNSSGRKFKSQIL